MRFQKLTMLLAACALLLTNCAGTPAQSTEPQPAARVRKPLLDARFHAERAEGDGTVMLDLSCVSEGYAAVSARSERRLKLRVIRAGEVYTYDLPRDGTPCVVPLSCGSGEYRFRVMEQVSGSSYAERCSVSREVSLLDEFQPFLRPSVYVPYNENSLCVRKAGELAAACSGESETAAAICSYIRRSVRYDGEKAAALRSGYLPDPDGTLRSGRGICFDYAALAAAMLRSQGIPTKLVVGHVLPERVCHAWIMVYTAGRGWQRTDFTAPGAREYEELYFY